MCSSDLIDIAGAHECEQRGVHRLHAEAATVRDRAADLQQAAVAHERPHLIVDDQDLVRRAAATAIGATHELLAHHGAQRPGERTAECRQRVDRDAITQALQRRDRATRG